MSKRNAILAAATRLFSEKGFKETSMAELSKITGAAGGTIFHHFKNKEDLFCNVLIRVEKTVTQDFITRTDRHAGQNGLMRTRQAVTDYLELAGTHADEILLLHRYYPYQKARTTPRCRQSLESIYSCLIDVFESCIQDGVSDGSVRVSSPRNTAMILFGLVDGVTRLHTHNIYHAGSLLSELMTSCTRILAPHNSREKEV